VRAPPEDAALPLLAALLLVDLLAEAIPRPDDPFEEDAPELFLPAVDPEEAPRPDLLALLEEEEPPLNEEELLLEAGRPLEDEELRLVEAPPLEDFVAPPLEDDLVAPPLEDLPLEAVFPAFEEDFAALRPVDVLREAALLVDVLFEEAPPLDALFLAAVPRPEVLRLLLPEEEAPPFLATLVRVVLLADANPLLAEDFDADPLEAADLLEADFLGAAFLGAAFFAAVFLDVDLEPAFEAVLEEDPRDDFDEALEPPRPADDRLLEAAPLRPDLEADLEVDLPPARLPAVLEAVFLDDFAMLMGLIGLIIC
jgi:hypothetical protein